MWLKLKEGQSLQANIDISSIKSVAKHWTGSRLEPCLGEGCPCCLKKLPRRWRYQVSLFAEGEEQSWEFGEESMKDIQRIKHDGNRIQVTITRSGKGKTTRYRVLQGGLRAAGKGKDDPASETKDGDGTLRVVNKYTAGRYGHLVRN